MICFFTSARRVSCGTSGLCCVESTTAVDPLRPAVDVLHADLGFSVRPQKIELARPPRFTKPSYQLVRNHDRQRHQFGGLVAAIAEHKALVAGPAGVHAHRDTEDCSCRALIRPQVSASKP